MHVINWENKDENYSTFHTFFKVGIWWNLLQANDALNILSLQSDSSKIKARLHCYDVISTFESGFLPDTEW